METFNMILGKIDDFVWGIPLMLLILCGGLWLTIRVGALQIHKLPLALKWMVQNEDNGKGELSSFGALCTALSATIGTGNIVGVTTAICVGGPGALFWMLFAAFLGMATKYSEALLAVKYRTVDEDGHSLGGPFLYIEKGMGEKWKWLAKLFAVFGILAGLMGIGTVTQINGIASAVKGFFDPNTVHAVTLGALGDYSWATIITAIVFSILVMLILIGGAKRISKVAELVVPFMGVLYVLVVLILLITNIDKIPAAIVLIVKSAFAPKAAIGGWMGTMFLAMQKGVARGIFSNEAGLGSAPIAAAAAQTKDPVRQGLVSMTGVFLDTFIICLATGLTVVVTGAWDTATKMGMEGVDVTSYAFATGLPFSDSVARFLLMVCLAFFAFTTILGWDFYSERCLEYLSHNNHKLILAFRWAFIAMVFVGPFLTVSAVWTMADIFNGLMAIPNMIALFALSGVVAKETKMYFAKRKAGLDPLETDDETFAKLQAEIAEDNK